MKKSKRLLAVVAAVCVCLIVLAVYVLGNEPEESLSGTSVGPKGDVLAFADGYVVQNKGEVSLLTAPDGTSFSCGHPLLKAKILDGNIVTFYTDGFLYTQIFSSTLIPQEPHEGNRMPEELAFYDCNSAGDIYGVLSEGGKEAILYYFGVDNSENFHKFNDSIRFVHVAENGQLWVALENSYYVGNANGAGDFSSLHPVDGGKPYRVLCANTFIDANGSIWRINDYDKASAVLEGLPIQKLNLCSADEKGVVYLDENGNIQKVGWSGEELGSCFVSGTLENLTATEVLYAEGGDLYTAKLVFTPQEVEPEPTPSLEPEPTPSLEPEPTPSLEPTETPKPTPRVLPEWMDPRDGFLYITGEITVEQLIEIEKPQDILVQPEGSILCTGMTEQKGDKIFRIIVWGDCDGNGKLTKADMDRAQHILLGEDTEEWFFLAADRDEDGEVTTKDLLWLSGELEKG